MAVFSPWIPINSQGAPRSLIHLSISHTPLLSLPVDSASISTNPPKPPTLPSL